MTKEVSNNGNDCSDLPRAVICDLDGTLSLFNCHRKGKTDIRCPGAHFRNPYDASNCDMDTLNEPVAEVLEYMSDVGGCHIIFCTGREKRYKKQTEIFLDKHIKFPHTLLMRETGDNRKDSTVKEEMYNLHIDGKYKILFVLDDRLQAVSHWRSMGLICWQVAPGDF